MSTVRYRMIWLLISLISTACYIDLFLCPIAAGDSTAADDLPGVFEIASKGGLSISVVDMHRYDLAYDGWILTLGLVIQNRGKEVIDLMPEDFVVLDNSRSSLWSLSPERYPLKNSLKPGEIKPGETVIGSLAFEIKSRSRPVQLVYDRARIAISLDKEVTPPGTIYSPGQPVVVSKAMVGVEGISLSGDGKKLRIDYLVKNTGSMPLSLEDRDRGRFANLIDSRGMSYTPVDYKMLDPALPPGGEVEGYLIYAFPDGSVPRYLLFWPPDDDAVLFDLKQGSSGSG